MDPRPTPPAAPPRPPVPRAVLWVLAVVVVILAAGTWVALPDGEGGRDEPSTAALPDPSAKALPAMLPKTTFEGLDGRPLDLTDLRGRPVVFNVWASSCVPCVEEMPVLESLHRQYGERVGFVGVSIDDDEAAARRMAERTGVTYRLGLDPSGNGLRSLASTAIPVTVVLDAAGRPAWMTEKAIGPTTLRPVLDRLAGAA